ncbi:BRISC and BRCA1-A complex member 1-like [Bacillus rossius redtenbacheri]|uniref:BRISC and BRCA1-A complex member 1-like n=1 Tax=Bacillus rossius redtenbacheri TaxID=93214 RepID=UPI002FDCDBB0
MEQCSGGKTCLEIVGEKAESEEKSVPCQDMLNSVSVNVNDRTLSNSSSNSSSTNCSLNEDQSTNGDFLGDNFNRFSESKECDAPSPRKLPTVNCAEKIILCVDMCEDAGTTPFKIANGATYRPLYMIKRVIQIFVHNKQLLGRSHEFALMLLQAEGALWLRNFTRDLREVTAVLDDLLELSAEPGDVFDLSRLFDEVHKHVRLPAPDPANLARPPYTVRMILFYSRARCVPRFLSEGARARELLSSEFFTADVMYVHEDPCQDVFERLGALDEKGRSYVLHVARDATKLHNGMARLLAHPLQRPQQGRASYQLPGPPGDCD